MTIDLQIPDCELDEWISELKPYQRNTIKQLLATMSPEEVAKKWIMASGSQNIIHFGGTSDPEPFWDRFKSEFRRFVCNDEAYVEEKKALLAEAPNHRVLVMSIISGAIGANIGYAATLLTPAVAVLLYTVGKIGVNAYCNSG